MDKTDPLHSRGKWVRPPSSAALALLIDSRARDTGQFAALRGGTMQLHAGGGVGCLHILVPQFVILGRMVESPILEGRVQGLHRAQNPSLYCMQVQRGTVHAYQ